MDTKTKDEPKLTQDRKKESYYCPCTSIAVMMEADA
jgi:hypothetical protein